MKYEKPIIEIILMNEMDIITLSVETGGSGQEIGGDIGGWS